MREGARAGALLVGRFQLERPIGQGGMATIFRAIDHLRGEPCAVKLLHGAGSSDVDRFAREAEVLAQLTHPAIVRYVAHGRLPSNELYLVMEWLEGQDLSQRLAHAGMTPAEAVALVRRVADGLATAHARGVVHRDIKPSNVFLPDGDIARAKILDFGIARLGEATSMTRTGNLLGTPAYMAPEQARGHRGVDARADVFSLGCILFECLTGRVVFRGEHVMAVLTKVLFEDPPPLSDLVPGVDPALAQLAAQMLAKDPAARPRDGAAVVALLAALGHVTGERAAPTSTAAASLTATEQRLHCVVLAGAIEGRPMQSASGTNLMVTMEQPTGTLSELRAEVARFGGRLERLLDGSVAVTLLGTGAATDQVAQAARCALAMRKFLPEVPIALATGRGIVAERWPMGEAIDRAARLLRRHQGRGVLLDEATAALLDARFEVIGDPEASTRGEPPSSLRRDATLELIAERPVGEGARTLLGRATPCVGRERELGTLQALYDECVEEPVARAVIVVGPVGVGKSRLRYELARRLAQHQRPPEVWIARGDTMSAGSPFGLAAQLLRRASGIQDGEPLEVRRHRLSERIARTGLALGPAPEESHRAATDQRLAEFLGEVVGAQFPDDSSVQLRAARQDPMLMGDQIRRAWEDFVGRACADRPLLIVLEDMHWGDLPTVKLIDTALRNLADRPLMVLALGRIELTDVFPKLWAERSAAVMGIAELTRKASERLVRQVLGPDVAAETTAMILERAQGNAFYLEELIRAVAAGERDRLPETVLAMVQARLDALEPAARHVLRAASVFGQVFWGEGVRRLLGGVERTGELRDWLMDLAERELITARPASRFPGQPELVFRHALLREAAYAMLTDTDRALGHRLAAEWLSSVGESDALVLAEHFERGGEPARSVRLYRRAAEQALEGDDLAAAVDRAERGVRCGASGEDLGWLRLLQAEAHGWRAEHGEAVMRAVEAMTLVPRGSAAWFGGAGVIAESIRATGDHDRLVVVAGELAAAHPGAQAREAFARAAALMVASAYASARYELVAPLSQRLTALEAELTAPEPATRAWIENARSWEAMYAGDAGRCLEIDRRVVESFSAVGDLRNACVQRASVAYDMLVLGANRDAEIALREIIVTAERMGLKVVVAMAKHNLGLALARLGQLDEARLLETDAVARLEDQANWRLAGAARAYLAQILLLAGDAEAARLEAMRSAEVLRVAPPAKVQALATLGEALLALGRSGEALAAAREARQLMDELGEIEEGEAHARLVLAEALAAVGDPRAKPELAAARANLLARADKIADAAWRESFLYRVPENARTLRLAEEWGLGASTVTTIEASR